MTPEPPTADPDRPAALARLAVGPDAPLPELLRRACEAAADALGADRAGVWLVVDEGKRLRCVDEYDRAAGRHLKGATRAAAEAAPAGRLDVPLVRDGRAVGVVCCEQAGRAWADADRAFARRVAEFLADRMRAAERALRTAVQPAPAPVVATPAAAGLAHDFRNALSEVLANAELIARTPDLPAEVPARVDRITAAATRGVGLLRGLLAPIPPADDTSEHTPLPPNSASLRTRGGHGPE